MARDINNEDIEIEKERLKELECLVNYNGKDKVITSNEALRMIEEERKKPVLKFFTKIPTLDKILDGFREGDLVVVSGPTKNGKSSLCQTFTINLSADKVPCLWFSYELTQREFLEKFGEPIPYFLLPQHLETNSINWIEMRIIESIAKYGTKVVFIDHLHYLIDMSYIGQRGNVSLIIGALMRELKKIALKWNICIVLIAHTTKLKFDEEPTLSDIRDSSFVSQESNTVLMIYRLVNKQTKEYEDKARLTVLANRRNGKTGRIVLVFQNNKFLEETEFYDKTDLQ